MMETPRYIAELAAKRLAGTLTAVERDTLEQWADSAQAYRSWLDALTWERLMETLEAQTAYQPVENVWDNPALWQHIQASPPHRRPLYRTPVFGWAVAVAALLLVTVGLFFWNRGIQGNRQEQIADAATEILPGGNRATLTLADGRTIDLSEAQQGIIVGDELNYTDGSAVLSEQVSMGASEQGDGVEGNHKFTSSQIHTLTTPKGGTYQVILPDGTRVWLNAASTLKYPSRFSGDERVVELTGEAYFDVSEQVTKGASEHGAVLPTTSQPHRLTRSQPHRLTRSQKIPFKVVTNGQTVEVLGTEFNISAYVDDPETRTTLVEGKVKVAVSNRHVGLTTNDLRPMTYDLRLTTNILAPGDQAITRNARTQIHQVDVAQYTAWKDGRFAFTGKPFSEIMAEFARWYDVEVRYGGAVPNESLVGGAYRTDDFGTVLRLLESGGIPYRVDGRTLIINPKEGGTN